MYTKEQVAQKTDHSVLKPEYTDSDLERHARMCIKNNVYSMCVKPCHIKKTKELLSGSGVKTSCVLSFPHGADTIHVKTMQAKDAIDNGVDEIDMVMNIGKFLGGNYDYVLEDIKSVTDIARKEGVLVKVILETGFLSQEQIAEACELAVRGGADFVKTSTGFGPGKATPEAVEIMLKTVGKRAKVKASGGIRTAEDAVAFLELGAERLGIGSTEEVLSGFKI
jgi:deoxyribose-phosphate aldolase